MMAIDRQPRLRRLILAGLAAVTLFASTFATAESASAFPRRGFHGGPGFRPYYHHRGIGTGAAIGLGVLGAVAAGAAASRFYNGYPVYPEGAHTGYGYDYYPDHGGYYGPY